MTTKFGMAQPVRRVEDPRLLVGDGRYTDDLAMPGATFGVVVRSPHARAKVLSVDTAAASAMPGVLLVVTGADLEADGIGDLPCGIPLKNRDGSPRADVPHPALATSEVRHVGDPVAFIVAETHQAARDAAEAVRLAEEEAKARGDVYTHDALAWALCRAGRAREAEAESGRALALGTKDASLYYHAAVIAGALGDAAKGAKLASTALSLNPHFDPAGADDARRDRARKERHEGDRSCRRGGEAGERDGRDDQQHPCAVDPHAERRR